MTMTKTTIYFNANTKNEDRTGNNAAFTCPVCGKVFLVSRFSHREIGHSCPWCGKSKGYAPNGDSDLNRAYIEWPCDQ